MTLTRSIKNEKSVRELSDGARQYLEVPNSPLSFLIERKNK